VFTSVSVGRTDTVAEHLSTMQELLREARALLGTLPASDPRAVLLGLAVQRRDGVLLKGVLANLREAKEGERAPRGRRDPR
jgi:hypothetical protein